MPKVRSGDGVLNARFLGNDMPGLARWSCGEFFIRLKGYSVGNYLAVCINPGETLDVGRFLASGMRGRSLETISKLVFSPAGGSGISSS